MVTTPSPVTFPNKKPNAIADVDIIDIFPGDLPGDPGAASAGVAAESIRNTIAITYTKALNETILKWSANNDVIGGSGVYRIRRDNLAGAIIVSQGVGSGKNTITSPLITNEPVGTSTFVLTIEETSPNITISSSVNILNGHQATEYETSAKNTNIISG